MGVHAMAKMYVLLVTSSVCVTVLASRAYVLQRREDAGTPTTRESVVLTDDQKKLIVDTHNNYRSAVHPKATTMKPLVWDDAVADYAGKWATCATWFVHRNGTNILEDWGENLEICTASFQLKNMTRQIESALDRWWSEKAHYEYSTNQCEPDQQCGHYTQMAWWSATRIGCSYAMDCPATESQPNPFNVYLVCNYDPAGNIATYRPYAAEDVPSETETEAETMTVTRIRTYGGKGIGSFCNFPFTHKGKTHNTCIKLDDRDNDWCRTETGGWGYCYSAEDSKAEACADTVMCQPYKTLLASTCTTLPENIKTSCCGSSCSKCECLTERPCENGGVPDGYCGCTCPPNTGWTGEMCTLCALTESTCNGQFNAAECRCSCSSGQVGFDCLCDDETGALPNADDVDVSCSDITLDSGLCECPSFSIEAKKYCGKTCGTCPSVDDILRGGAQHDSLTKRDVSMKETTRPRGPCAAKPCTHGGTCEQTSALLNEYTCKCTEGWRGQKCRISRKLPPLEKIRAQAVSGHIKVQLKAPKCDPNKELTCARLFQVRLQTFKEGLIVDTKIVDSTGTKMEIHEVQPKTRYRISGCIRVLTEDGEDGVGPWCPPAGLTTP